MIETEIFSGKELEILKELISSASNVIVTCHERPDGDALGSCLALNSYFRKKGINSVVITPTVYPNFLKWLPGDEDVLSFDKDKEKAEELIKTSHLIFCLDFNDLKRLGDMGEAAKKSKADCVTIDHHPDPQPFAKITFVDPDASSTSELVYDLILSLDDESIVDYDIAVNLYTGILTDTGSFQYSNTSPKVHSIISKLIERGIDPSLVHNAVYNSFSLNRLKFFGYCLTRKLKVIPAKRAAYIAISSEEMKKYAIGVGDTEGLVNLPLKMKNVDIAALFKEQNDKIKISFRSKGDNNVNLLARTHFNGGGHKNASGGHSDTSLEETTCKFEEILNHFNF